MVERKEKTLRILQILESTDEQSPLNAIQIINKLDNDYNLQGIDRRAIYRDISMLQYCGYDIVQCENHRRGWYMNSHLFRDWEIKIMIDTLQQTKCLSENEIIHMRERLLLFTSKEGRKRLSHMIQPVICNSVVDEDCGIYIELMIRAMYQHRKIEFQYTEISDEMKKILRRNGKVYQLSLYTIYWSGDNYYLIGAHDNHDSLTSYRLDRICNLCISDERAIDAKDKIGPNPEKQIQKYIKESVNHFLGERIRIEVEYVPEPVTNAILYDFVGKDIVVRKMEDRIYRANFTKTMSVTLIAWFVQYSDRFRVVSPNSLVNEIIDTLNKGVENYRMIISDKINE